VRESYGAGGATDAFRRSCIETVHNLGVLRIVLGEHAKAWGVCAATDIGRGLFVGQSSK